MVQLLWLLLPVLINPTASQQRITRLSVPLGSDASLPCKPDNTIDPITYLQLFRHDRLNEGYLLLFRDGRFETEGQRVASGGRVELKNRLELEDGGMEDRVELEDGGMEDRVELEDGGMKGGDYVLVLKNVSMEDRGHYGCEIHQKESGGRKTVTVWEFYLDVGRPEQQVSAPLWSSGVLPCQAKDVTNSVSEVEWSRSDQDQMKTLLVFREGRLQEHVGPYRERVGLKDGGMKDGDVSLLLNNVRMEDQGRYRCTVLQRGRRGDHVTVEYSHLTVGPPDGVALFVSLAISFVATLVFTIVGTLVGTLIGNLIAAQIAGPVGKMIGCMIGGLIGGLVIALVIIPLAIVVDYLVAAPFGSPFYVLVGAVVGALVGVVVGVVVGAGLSVVIWDRYERKYGRDQNNRIKLKQRESTFFLH